MDGWKMGCEYDFSFSSMYGWMKNGMPITYEYDFSFFIHPSSHPWFSILESSKRAWRGFSWPFGILWTLLCCGLGQGRGATTRERERERERWRAFLSSVLLAKRSFDPWKKLRNTRSLPSMPIFKNPQNQYVCVIVIVVLFFSLLSSSAYQVCRSALLKSFWMDPLSNETYFCSSFVVNTSRLVSGPFFCCCMTNSVLIMKKAAAAILIFFP
jgi:hypothetical protein